MSRKVKKGERSRRKLSNWKEKQSTKLENRKARWQYKLARKEMGSYGKTKIRQENRTERTAIRQGEQTERVEARQDTKQLAIENGINPWEAQWSGIGGIVKTVGGTVGSIFGGGGGLPSQELENQRLQEPLNSSPESKTKMNWIIIGVVGIVGVFGTIITILISNGGKSRNNRR